MRSAATTHAMLRRRLLAAALAPLAPLALPRAAGAAQERPDRPRYPVVLPGVPLRFPHDHGAHPDYRTEWWYATGALDAGPRDGALRRYGFQITFFRSRLAIDPRNPSRFAAHQVVFAHAALSDRTARQLVHDQRAARAAFGRAGAAEGDTRLWLGDWRLERHGEPRASVYRASLPAQGFAFELELRATQPVLLHGEAGYSRKGPEPVQASWYYTQPQLAVSGTLRVPATDRRLRELPVAGRAWLDHEWSSEILAPGAVGWDWIGVNLEGGGALMAFRIRDAKGAALWAAGTWREATGRLHSYAPDAVHFEPLRHWRSPRNGALYPVEQRVRVGPLALRVVPWFDDQELDSSASTGVIYWEGASDILDERDGRPLGTGYLELTGYHRPLRL
jgi:predicted secreted hydrolase